MSRNLIDLYPSLSAARAVRAALVAIDAEPRLWRMPAAARAAIALHRANEKKENEVKTEQQNTPAKAVNIAEAKERTSAALAIELVGHEMGAAGLLADVTNGQEDALAEMRIRYAEDRIEFATEVKKAIKANPSLINEATRKLRKAARKALAAKLPQAQAPTGTLIALAGNAPANIQATSLDKLGMDVLKTVEIGEGEKAQTWNVYATSDPDLPFGITPFHRHLTWVSVDDGKWYDAGIPNPFASHTIYLQRHNRKPGEPETQETHHLQYDQKKWNPMFAGFLAKQQVPALCARLDTYARLVVEGHKVVFATHEMANHASVVANEVLKRAKAGVPPKPEAAPITRMATTGLSPEHWQDQKGKTPKGVTQAPFWFEPERVVATPNVRQPLYLLEESTRGYYLLTSPQGRLLEVDTIHPIFGFWRTFTDPTNGEDVHRWQQYSPKDYKWWRALFQPAIDAYIDQENDFQPEDRSTTNHFEEPGEHETYYWESALADGEQANPHAGISLQAAKELARIDTAHDEPFTGRARSLTVQQAQATLIAQALDRGEITMKDAAHLAHQMGYRDITIHQKDGNIWKHAAADQMLGLTPILVRLGNRPLNHAQQEKENAGRHFELVPVKEKAQELGGWTPHTSSRPRHPMVDTINYVFAHPNATDQGFATISFVLAFASDIGRLVAAYEPPMPPMQTWMQQEPEYEQVISTTNLPAPPPVPTLPEPDEDFEPRRCSYILPTMGDFEWDVEDFLHAPKLKTQQPEPEPLYEYGAPAVLHL